VSLSPSIVEVVAAVARQRLGKHVPAAMTTQPTVEELLVAVFYMQSVSYQIFYEVKEK
jgi:hypothetical protein